MRKRIQALLLSLIMVLSTLAPAFTADVYAAEVSTEVSITQTDTSEENYFVFSEIGWDGNDGSHAWSKAPSADLPASDIWYEVHFVGHKIEIYAGKNWPMGSVEYFIDGESQGTYSLTANANTAPSIIATFDNLTEGEHTFKAVATGNGSQGKIDAGKAVVYSVEIEEPGVTPDPVTEETTKIPHTKQSGDSNYFTFSETGWSAMGQSAAHVWSDKPTSAEEAANVWYEVKFVGHAIDIYAGKNWPHGNVKYFIDGEEAGTFNLYNGTNIDSTKIHSITGLEEKEHTFRAVAVDTNKCIDCAEVVVYHAPYKVTGLTLTEESVTIAEGATKQITYTTAPDYAALSGVEYKSSNEDVATVDEAGVITAVGAGTANITLSAANYAETKTIAVTVTEVVPGMAGSIVDTDTQWTEDRYDEVKGLGVMSASLTAWKNDKAVSELALVSVDSALKNVTVTASDLVSGDNTIAAENVTATFIKSTKAYNGGYLGYGSPDRVIPADNGTNRSESSDILYQTTPMDVPFDEVQPVWVEFAIPEDAAAGTYTGTLTVTADKLEAPLVFTYTVEVQDAVLNDAEDYTFDIMQWQYPYSSAEYYDVEPFSNEHLDILKSNMEIYKEVGGNAITTTFTEEAWSGQTYSKNSVHYPSMVKWTKNSDGTFSYDYTDFDKWVSLCKEMGLGDKIVAYGIAAWHGSFTYWTEGAAIYTKEAPAAGSARYNEVWGAFLADFADHLESKGWKENVYIGIDERNINTYAFDLAEAAGFKTSSDIDSIADAAKKEIAKRVTALNIGDSAAKKHAEAYEEILAAREAKGYKTTVYSCTEHVPGQFSLSAPVESYWAVIHAAKMGADGFNRWAYDAWVADPLNDATHNSFEPGDCFVIFPDEKDAENPTSKYSVRLARMAEGVRDVNKIEQMVADQPTLADAAEAAYANLEYVVTSVGGGRYLNDAEVAQLAAETASFKEDLNTLTARYIALEAGATDEVESVAIEEGTAVTLTVGATQTLHAVVKPDNLLNTSVTWSSSDDQIVSVDEDGEITAIQTGEAVITATSNADATKRASITVTVEPVKVDDSKKVAYYSFDNVTDGKLVNEWAEDRNGTIDATATFTEGKSGNALSVNEAGKGAVITDSSDLDNADWTVAYWVKTTSDFTTEISVLEDSTRANSLSLKLASDRANGGFRTGDGSGDVLTFKNFDVTKDTWYHLTWVQNKTTGGLSLYVNGTKADSNNWTVGNSIKAPIEVIGGTGFTGLIDEVKIFNTVLTEEEIASIMQVPGINLDEASVEIYLGDTHQIKATVISENEDRSLTYESADESIATVDENGLVTAVGRGRTTITITNEATGYKAELQVKVSVEISIINQLIKYILPEKYQSNVEGAASNEEGTLVGTNRQYLGQPDMVQTETGRLITVFPTGHGHGPLIMKVSDDQGETWTEKTDIPDSWAKSQETPTIYSLQIEDATEEDGYRERLVLICACPNWDLQLGGWQMSYSDDNGETWTEFENFHQNINGSKNYTIVAMASLIQLKDEEGNYIQKWMGVYHNDAFVNYKTYLTFDEEGNPSWTAPVPYLSEYRSIESSHQICEVGMFRSPDGERIVALARTQTHNAPATMFYSDDEGETWSEPVELPGSLAGERHKAKYVPGTEDKLLITFREIDYDRDNDGVWEGGGDWTAGEWVAWVGTYEDLMNLQQGDYMIVLDEDFANNTFSGDTGYTGMAVLEDGTFVLHSYGHWDQAFSSSYTDGGSYNVRTDLCWIRQAKFNLAELEEELGIGGEVDPDQPDPDKPDPDKPDVDAADDSKDIPVEQYTLSAGSTQNGKDKELAIDGNTSTYWEVQWDIGRDEPDKLWYQIELEEAAELEGLRYLPRWGADYNGNGTANGSITRYRVEVKTTEDGEWTKVSEGSWAANPNVPEEGWKFAEFPEGTTAKYVRLTALNTYGDGGKMDWNMSAVEIRLKGTKEFVDKSALAKAIEDATALLAAEGEYTPESWAAANLAVEIPAAEAVYNNDDATKEDVAAAVEALTAAVAKLEKVQVEEKLEGVTRIAGDGRIDTGLAVADALKATLKKDKFDTVIIARSKGLNAKGEDTGFADALAGSYLAVKEEAPILLISDSRMADVVNYVKGNLEADGKVFILGGEAAVSPALEGELAGYDVERLGGADRYETNLMILDAANVEKGGELIVATGKAFADSLSASASKLPILTVKGDKELTDDQKTFLEEMAPSKIYIVGGESAVNLAIEGELKDSCADVVRVAGANRRATSIEVAKTFAPDATVAVTATAAAYPDGLCGGPLAAALNAPLILTRENNCTEADEYMAAEGIDAGYVLGGDSVLPDDIVKTIYNVEEVK